MEGNLVTVSNVFVRSRYAIGLVEKRLLNLYISQINNNICKKEGNERDSLEVIDCNTPYILSVRDYSDLYSLEYESAKDELSKAVDNLFKKEVTYMSDDNTIVTTRWISSKIKYIKGEHSLALKWAPDIIPLISELRSNFTSYRLKFLRTLPSTYSIRLYEIFIMELTKSRRRSIEVTLTIDTLRELFILQDKYKLFADFMKRVIEEPINQINKDINTNIIVTIGTRGRKYNKIGKKVVSITFVVEYKGKQKKTVYLKKGEDNG